MNRPGPKAVEAPAAGNSHNVAALIRDFTEQHLRQRRKHPEYAERILQKELAALLANLDEVTKGARRTFLTRSGRRDFAVENSYASQGDAQVLLISTDETGLGFSDQ